MFVCGDVFVCVNVSVVCMCAYLYGYIHGCAWACT